MNETREFLDSNHLENQLKSDFLSTGKRIGSIEQCSTVLSHYFDSLDIGRTSLAL